MILLIAGTSDSYQIIKALKKQKKNLIATVTTDYGEKLIKDKFKIRVIKKRLDQDDIYNLIKKEKISLVVDSTHPFAEEISKKAIKAAEESGIEYLRFERKEFDLSQYAYYNAKIIKTSNYEKAAKIANDFEKIFLTTGSKNVEIFINEISNFENRLFMRIMTFPAFIQNTIDLGLPPANIIAAKGPFTKEFNQSLFKEYGADVIITKASGDSGGLKSKIEAAVELGIAVIVIQRPKINYPLFFNEVDNLINYIKANYKTEV
ncbi:precorrin-6A reductase [Halanaerobium sp. MA284_MarDTE_T2]|jgi:precorrin-6A/cobalt-precorrin-6A reductase|uniref:precorrin-6A reductase n=1 Tax=Halanaerobium sp. MA284_MarDTE_T2 TaxID=2183913 RepID=UPI000DF4C2D5|nr:precorrin-6A reductase [Halanaerobium sp. MA284_MarDTE_T2]RCW50444.1 precorrin-6A/cobalt-precorrin-6A reductase [Halanaerobium sp. MA284_MarDTE_T2]